MLKRNLIITIILSLMIGLGGGYGLGLIQQESKEDVLIFPRLKMIQGWRTVVTGEVTKISGQTLTLNYDEDILPIFIEEDARISRRVILNKETKEIELQEIEFEDIKIGDNLHISAELKEGELRGISVIILF